MKYKLFKLFFFLIIIFLPITCRKKSKNFEDNNPITQNIDSIFFAKKNNPTQLNSDKLFLNQYKKDYWDLYDLWGGFLVARKGQIIYEHYAGFSDVLKNKKNNLETPLHIASISKVLTATLVLKLINQKLLSLDTPVNQILTQFPYPEITIKMLLNHRSGLIKYADFTSNKLIWNAKYYLQNKDIFDLLVKHKPNLYFVPNTKFTYSNTNYVLLAMIIEKITKKTYAEAMQQFIFDPLQMNHSFVYNLNYFDKASKSYYYGGNKVFTNDFLDLIYGDKNIYSTPRDLLKFDKALYSDKFLSKNLKEIAYKGYSYESYGIKNYGLGMRIMEWGGSKKILYHNGWWHGNNTVFIHNTKDTVSIIALGNKYSNKMYKAVNLIGYFGGYPRKLEKNDTMQNTQK